MAQRLVVGLAAAERAWLVEVDRSRRSVRSQGNLASRGSIPSEYGASRAFGIEMPLLKPPPAAGLLVPGTRPQITLASFDGLPPNIMGAKVALSFEVQTSCVVLNGWAGRKDLERWGGGKAELSVDMLRTPVQLIDRLRRAGAELEFCVCRTCWSIFPLLPTVRSDEWPWVPLRLPHEPNRFCGGAACALEEGDEHEADSIQGNDCDPDRASGG